MLKKYTGLSVLLLTVLFMSCSQYTAPPAKTQPAAPAVSTSNMETSILAYINAYRRTKGLPDLRNNDLVAAQAEQHSRNMATGRTGFGHSGFEQRVKTISTALGGVMASAENVAYGSQTARQVVDGWLNSSGHRKNIEGNYNLTGIGVYADKKGTLYFTQLFVRRG